MLKSLKHAESRRVLDRILIGTYIFFLLFFSACLFFPATQKPAMIFLSTLMWGFVRAFQKLIANLYSLPIRKTDGLGEKKKKSEAQ